jgi:type II secretory pathway pseudopilin PulG
MIKKTTSYNAGLTLIETVVSVGIIVIIMGVVVSSVLFFYRANSVTLEQSYEVDQARKGVSHLVRDLREATLADTGAYPLASLASTSLTFYSDVDGDTNVEQITYALIGTTTLTRTVLNSTGNPLAYTGVGSSTNVSQYVRNLEEGQPIFRYYDEDGAEISNYTDILRPRFVSITLIVNISPVRAPNEFTLRSSATLRNLR